MDKKDKVRTLVEDILIRILICKHLGMRNEHIIFKENNYGKPYLERFKEFHFIISYSGDYVVCAIANHPLGVDIEQVKKFDCEEISKIFFQ